MGSKVSGSLCLLSRNHFSYSNKLLNASRLENVVLLPIQIYFLISCTVKGSGMQAMAARWAATGLLRLSIRRERKRITKLHGWEMMHLREKWQLLASSSVSLMFWRSSLRTSETRITQIVSSFWTTCTLWKLLVHYVLFCDVCLFSGFFFKMLCQCYLDKNASLCGLFMKIPSVEHEELYTERQKFWSTIMMNKYSCLSESIIQMAKALINFPALASAIPLL